MVQKGHAAEPGQSVLPASHLRVYKHENGGGGGFHQGRFIVWNAHRFPLTMSYLYNTYTVIAADGAITSIAMTLLQFAGDMLISAIWQLNMSTVFNFEEHMTYAI